MIGSRVLRRAVAVVAALGLAGIVAAPATAHEARAVNGYEVEVGFATEPAYVGDRNGLFLSVKKDGQPVEGVEQGLRASVAYGSQARELTLTAQEDAPGTYVGAFIPTAAGKYTFLLTGSMPDGSRVDQSFTSSPTGFDEVQEVAAGQFPVQFPSQAQIASNAQKGAGAAGQAAIALALGGIGALLGLAALGVAVAGRQRAR